MVNKHYPDQFKTDAVALYRSRPGATIAQIADDLGVNRETLRSWVRADDQQRGATAGPAAAAARPGQAPGSVEEENAELLVRLLLAGKLHAVRVPGLEEEALRDLVRAREAARVDLMRCRHRELPPDLGHLKLGS